jgi:hypothetical protein
VSKTTFNAFSETYFDGGMWRPHALADAASSRQGMPISCETYHNIRAEWHATKGHLRRNTKYASMCIFDEG